MPLFTQVSVLIESATLSTFWLEGKGKESVTLHPSFSSLPVRISKHPTLTSIAAQLLGDEEVWLFQQQALLKDPGDPNPTPWHQDDHYWQTGGRAITAWFPLEPVSKENGTMSLVPGSHKWEVLEHVRAKGASLFRTVKENLDNSMFVPLELRPGSVSFHHSKTIHGAFANMGSVRRIALAQHYVSPRHHLLLVERRAERRKKAELARTRSYPNNHRHSSSRGVQGRKGCDFCLNFLILEFQRQIFFDTDLEIGIIPFERQAITSFPSRSLGTRGSARRDRKRTILHVFLA